MHRAHVTAFHDRPSPVSLFGRDREQARLRDLFDRMLDGDGRLILIGGEAGIGKTALVNALNTHAEEAGALVLTGHCYDLTATPPYGPWIEITDRYASVDGLPVIPDVLQPRPGMDGTSDQTDRFVVARDFLKAVAAQRPLVLVLEDLHWADLASLDLLRYVARQLGGHRLLVVATYRDDEITREHPLFRLLPILVREAGAHRLELSPLVTEDVYALVTSVYQLEKPDAVRLTAYLLDSAEGNPLYIREILRTLAEEGRLTTDGNVWSLRELTDVPVPPLLLQVIERRLERLSARHRTYLEDAAAIGHEMSLDLWRVVSDSTDAEQISTVEQAIEANLMSASARLGHVAFSHALVREALYDGTSPPRRQLLHLRIAESMIELGNPDPDAVSYHLTQAGDSRAPEWLVLAAERAQRSYAWKTAAERFAEASNLLCEEDTRLRERGWLLYRTARLLRFSELPRAVKLLDEAEIIGKQTGDPALAAYSLFDRGAIRSDSGGADLGFDEMRSGILALDTLPDEYRASREIGTWVADIAPAVSTGDRGDSAPPATPSVNVRRGAFAVWNMASGRFNDAIAIANQYIDEFDLIPHPDHSLLGGYADAVSALAVSYAALARPVQARDACFKAYDTYKVIGHHNQAAIAATRYLSRIHLPFSTYDLKERQRFVQILDEFVQRAEDAMHDQASDAFVNFDLLWVEAEWDRIRAHGSPALTFPSSHFRQSGAVALARLERASGNPDRAWGHVNRVLPLGPESKPGNAEKFQFSLEVQPVAAHLAMDAGDLDLARRWIESHDRWLSWSGAVAWAPAAELLWARYHRFAGDRSHAMQHANRCLELSSDPEQPLALISAHRFVGELLSEQRSYEEADDHLRKSLQLTEECAAPFERALTLLALAELRASTGDVGGAKTLLDEVVWNCEPLGARPTLERATTLRARIDSRKPRAKHPAGLTRREVDVLRLIAQGMSDREIANELFISHHTVMRHVSHLLAKLEVESRSAAAVTAVRLGIV